MEGVQKASILIASYTESSRGLSNQYPADVLKALPLHLASEWDKAKSAAWPLSVFKRKAVLHELSSLGVPHLDLDRDLDRLRQMREIRDAVERLGEQAKLFPGWNGVGTDLFAIQKITAGAAKLRLLVARAADTPAQTAALRVALQTLLGERKEELAAGFPLHGAGLEYIKAYGLFSDAMPDQALHPGQTVWHHPLEDRPEASASIRNAAPSTSAIEASQASQAACQRDGTCAHDAGPLPFDESTFRSAVFAGRCASVRRCDLR